MLFIRTLLLTCFLFEFVSLFKQLFIDGQQEKWIQNMATSFFALGLFLILLEGVFMFIPRSHTFGETLGSKIWMMKHWPPLNSYGFRDKEPNLNNYPNIFFVGDSFTAGHGLKRVDDRFSNKIEQYLRDDDNQSFNVLNIGQNGYDTHLSYTSMIELIDSSQITPDFIILQYYGNDIEGAARRSGSLAPSYIPYLGLNPLLKHLVKGSYLCNYFYWLSPRQDIEPYNDYLKKIYSDTTIMQKHQEDLLQFVAFAKDNELPLLVLVFPFLRDLAFSNSLYVEQITAFLQNEKVPFIDVRNIVKNIPVYKRVVNSNDGHPSAKVNELLAKKIYQKIKEIQ